ncbi:MAG: hypothetical protein AUJ71_01280 [Candidatus Omnitrophica bacterium CG1_02_49_16]|nr:MAG: hypothetical protein AUJ71_01280 [Candidatus Omnitrophica bacterium CG1_02_49_16]
MTDRGYDVLIIGGGAAGITAAISARRAGAAVLLCEKMPRLGKKIRASGNGRCNLLNDTLDVLFYNAQAREFVKPIFARFGKKEILHFFKDLGLRVYSDKGRIFPATNQAVSVMEVLEMELARLDVPIRYDSEITNLEADRQGFKLSVKSGGCLNARKIIFSTGGKSYPVSGSDGTAYALLTRFGHHLIEPVPSTVPLVVKDPWCLALSGQRIRATVRQVVDGKTGSPMEGELLFTDYGLSGTAILDSSEEISIALNRQPVKTASILVDLLPFMHADELHKELSARLRKKFPSEKLLIGLLPHKFAGSLAEVLKTRDPGAITVAIKHKEFFVNGTRGWDEAEFTAGGIDTREVDPLNLESKLQRGLYFAGEILNVHGKRGGYNLAWAWASGFIAGMGAGVDPVYIPVH